MANGTFDTDGKLTFDVELNDDCLAGIQQIYIQNGAAGQVITVKSVRFYDATVADEPEVTTGVSLDLPAMKEAIIANYENQGYTYDSENDKLTKEGVDDDVVFTTDNVHAVADYLEASGNDFFTVAQGADHASYREQNNLAHICLRGGLVFELENASTLTVEVSSTGNDPKYTDFYLVDVAGTAIEVSEISGVIDENASEDKLADYKGQPTYVIGDGITSFNGETTLLTVGQYATRTSSYHTTATWVLAVGTYTLYGRNSGSFVSDLRIYDITIEDASIDESDNETEIEGFLTVTVGETEVAKDEAVKISVTENDDETITVELGDLAVSIVTITDASVTFTPDASTGEYTVGVVSGKLYGSDISATATGTYVVEDGETIFTASFSYTVPIIGNLDIVVSFTTVGPAAEPEYGWTLITDEFDATQLDGNNQIIIPMTTIEQYEKICIVTTVDISKSYGNYGAILTNGEWNSEFGGGNFTCNDTEETVTLVLSVEDLVEAITIDNLVYVVWDNVSAVAIYGYGEISEDTESGTEETQANVYACSMTFDISKLDLSSGNYFAIFVEDANGNSYWTLGFSDVVVTVDGVTVDMTGCTGYSDNFDNGCLKLFELWGSLAETPIPADVQSMTVSFNLSTRWDDVTAEEFATLTFTVQIDPADGDKVKVAFSGTELLSGAIYDALETVKSDTEVVEVARYNLMGQKISGAEKGINIIVYSDGSAKKVLVK